MTEMTREQKYATTRDEELVLLAQSGDEEAQEFLLDKYKFLVRAKSRAYFLIGADNEDIIQEGIGQKPDEPLHTVTTSAGHFGVVTVKMSRSEMNLHHWNEVRELLNAYCGYAIAEDEILLLDVNGTLYFISDIGLRMLTPRELYAANGFPPDYIIDHDYTGKAYGKTKQVARCGNAVPPPFAEALVRANLPEMCGRQFETMKELHGVI